MKEILLKRIEDSFQRRVQAPKTIIVAVSGGADSIALLALLREFSQPRLIRLIVAHVNYGFRGEESEADAAFVAACCKDWDFVFHSFNAKELSYQGNKQEWARELRYEFFEKLRREHDADSGVVATAHHRDDMAENFIMRAARGGSLGNLKAMPAWSGPLWRPLYATGKAELQQYLGEEGLSFREDGSNAKSIYSRNRIRLEVLPKLEELYPGAGKRLAEFAQDLSQVDTYLEEVLAPLQAVEDNVLKYSRIKHLPNALQRHVLWGFIKAHAAAVTGTLGREQLDRFLYHASSSQAANSWNLSAKISLTYKGETFRLKVEEPAFASARFQQHAHALRCERIDVHLDAGVAVLLQLSDGQMLKVKQNSFGPLSLVAYNSYQSLNDDRAMQELLGQGEKSNVQFPFSWDYVKVYRGEQEIGRYAGEPKIDLLSKKVTPGAATEDLIVSIELITGSATAAERGLLLQGDSNE